MRIITVTFTACALCLSAAPQNPPASSRPSQPLYRVTIIARATKALNYGYLSAPTKIEFSPTPLLTGSRGEATVEPKRGSTLINAHFNNVPAPTRFGRQYLTYVVWAISPEGRAQNLGELSLDASGKGKLATSTPLQTFAMIVTAELYYSVTQPSDVVVLENQIGPNTIGKVQEVNASYELLPRKEFTYEPASPASPAAPVTGKPLSRDQYDAVLALYQAQNAIQMAEAQGAQRFESERIARARDLYDQARGRPFPQDIVATAREATQAAEDSRAISAKRADEERRTAEQLRVTQSQQQAAQARDAALRAEQARREQQDRMDAERARAARQPVAPAVAPAPPPIATTAPTHSAPIEVSPNQFRQMDPHAAENRRRILTALNGPFEVFDSPRGIVVTLPEAAANKSSLTTRLQPLVSAIRPYRDLHIEVEAHSAKPEFAVTQREADLVRAAMIAAGGYGDSIVAHGLGNSKPRASNSFAAGRAQNQRVEIVIAGDAIGSISTWDRTYTLKPR